MNPLRRHVLTASGSASLLALLGAAGFVLPGTAIAAGWNKPAFEGKTVREALSALGAKRPADSTDILLRSPDLAENGAVVPIGIESRIPDTVAIALLIEKNAAPLAAYFEIPEGTLPNVATRVKMAETSIVYALVKAGDQYFIASKLIKVTLGACDCGA